MDSVIKAIEPNSEGEDQLREELQHAIQDDFTIEREIGRGGMATVYLASQHHPSRQVAIKVLDPDVTTRLTRRRFLREVEVVSNLAHPHIVPIFSAGSDDDLLYYVMPFIEGETLRHRIAREGPLPLEEALHIVHDVADALDPVGVGRRGLGVVRIHHPPVALDPSRWPPLGRAIVPFLGGKTT